MNKKNLLPCENKLYILYGKIAGDRYETVRILVVGD